LLDERQIPDGHSQNDGQQDEKSHHLGEFVPDAKIHIAHAVIEPRSGREVNW
jgi:hypothetical protein